MLAGSFFLTACSNSAATSEPSAIPVVVATEPTPTVAPTELEVSEKDQFEYEIVYVEGGLGIREAFLGSAEDWTWVDFSIPQARIQHAVQDLGLDALCDDTTAEWQVTGWCSDTVGIKTANEQEYQFDLACDHMMGGHCQLRRNGTLVWEGNLNGGTCRPIHSSRRIGDDIAIDYTNVVTSGQMVVQSILLTRGTSVVDIAETTAMMLHLLQVRFSESWFTLLVSICQTERFCWSLMVGKSANLMPFSINTAAGMGHPFRFTATVR